MIKGKISINIQASNQSNGKKIAAVLVSIAENVPENDILQLYDLLQDNPDVLVGIMKKISNPIVKKFLV